LSLSYSSSIFDSLSLRVFFVRVVGWFDLVVVRVGSLLGGGRFVRVVGLVLGEVGEGVYWVLGGFWGGEFRDFCWCFVVSFWGIVFFLGVGVLVLGLGLVVGFLVALSFSTTSFPTTKKNPPNPKTQTATPLHTSNTQPKHQDQSEHKRKTSPLPSH